MRKDARIRFTRMTEGKKTTQWECWAETMKITTSSATLSDEFTTESSKVKMKINYAKQLDDIFESPTKYNIEFLDRKIPKAQVRRIQQMQNRRYVELEI